MGLHGDMRNTILIIRFTDSGKTEVAIKLFQVGLCRHVYGFTGMMCLQIGHSLSHHELAQALTTVISRGHDTAKRR